MFIHSNYLVIDNHFKLFIALKEYNNTSNKSSSNKDGAEIKLEPEDVHYSMVDVPEQIENKSDSSELSQNVDIFREHVSGNF